MKTKRPFCAHCRHDAHPGRCCGYGDGIGTTVKRCECTVDKRGRVVSAPETPETCAEIAAAALYTSALAQLAKALRAAADAADAVAAQVMGPRIFEAIKRRDEAERSGPSLATFAFGTGGFDAGKYHSAVTPKEPPAEPNDAPTSSTPPKTIASPSDTNGAATTPPIDAGESFATALLADGPLKVLAAAALYPDGATHRQIVAQTSYSARTVTNYAVELRKRALIEPASFGVTARGVELLRERHVDVKPKALEPGLHVVLAAMHLYPDGSATQRQVSLHTGLSVRTITNYTSMLRARGYVVKNALQPTAEGIAMLRDDMAAPVPRGRAIVNHYVSSLPSGEAEVLAEIVAAHPRTLSHEAIVDRTEFSPRTVTNYLSSLRSRAIVAGGAIALSTDMQRAMEVA